jgi:serine protease
LIIKFKTPKESKAAHLFAETSDTERVQGLKERAASTVAGHELNLRHLKTIYNDIQVASTGAPLTRPEMRSVIAKLAKDPAVEYVEIDERVQAHLTPNDTFFSSLWNLKSPAGAVGGANFQLAWDRMIGSSTPVTGAGVIVAVLDSGYRPHPDLAANVLQGYDFISADNPPINTTFTTANDGDGRDDNPTDPGDWNSNASDCAVEDSSWHGTHVAGTIAAVANNSSGVIGGAFGAKILPVRVLGVCGGYSSDIQEGMYWAAGLRQVNGVTNPNIAKVINMSLGSTGSCSDSYKDAVNAVVTAGTTVVVSAGNDDGGPVSSPANCSGVIAVTAHTITGEKSSFANVGAQVALSAPGSSIFSTDNTGRTTPQSDAILLKSGTSMAAPHVAAAAALLLQIKPTLTPAQIAALLKNNTRPFRSGTVCASLTTCGTGMLDAFAAVKALQVSEGSASNTPPSMTSAPTQTGTEGIDLQFDVTAVDADSDTVTFSSSGLPAGATLSSTGRFRWSIPVLGTYNFTVTPSDTSRSGMPQTVTLAINSATLATASSSGGGGGGGGGTISGWELALVALLAIRGLRRRRLPAHEETSHCKSTDKPCPMGG